MRRPQSLTEVTKEWIESIPKTISESGCWIPTLKPTNLGYVPVRISNKNFVLHRLVLMVYYGVDYYDKLTVSRHGPDCSKACFLYSHLTPGTDSENVQDTIIHGKNYNLNKEKCSKCGGYYTSKLIMSKGMKRWQRICVICRHRSHARWKLKMLEARKVKSS